MKRSRGHSLRAAPRGRASGNSRPDSDILFNIAKYLRKRYGVPQQQIKIDYAIRITGKTVEVLGSMTYEEISRIHGLIHTPDVMVLDGEGVPVLIIEQDGKSHDSEDHALKDEARNEHYKRTEIPFIIMKTSVIRALGVTRAKYLDSEMAQWGWRSYPGPGAYTSS